ncbi:MAG: RCC1 domain-containing protein [Kofleriaceae bacterium]
MCTRDDQCTRHGAPGTCLDGACSFSEPCGALGQACCATEPSCAAGSCSDGRCQSCIQDVAFGRRFGCVLKTDGTIWCAGENDRGQLGSGAAGDDRSTREPVRTVVDSALIDDAIQIALGRSHGCAIRSDTSVWCWGANHVGQLGNGTTNTLQPGAVQVLAGGSPLLGASEIRSGSAHTCAITSSGDVYCWGHNDVGQLGDGLTTNRDQAGPVLTAPMGSVFTGARSLANSAATNCVHRGTDEVWCWGADNHGQFGFGALGSHPSPALIGNAPGFALGHGQICMVRETSVQCTGASTHGSLANGEAGGALDELAPVTMKDDGGGDFTGASKITFAGGGGGCALMNDRSVQCWGDNQYGQAGTGKAVPFPEPVIDGDGVPVTEADRVVAAFPHACARKSTGEWLCWGRNSEGEFGDGTFSNRPLAAPLAVSCP